MCIYHSPTLISPPFILLIIHPSANSRFVGIGKPCEYAQLGIIVTITPPSGKGTIKRRSMSYKQCALSICKPNKYINISRLCGIQRSRQLLVTRRSPLSPLGGSALVAVGHSCLSGGPLIAVRITATGRLVRTRYRRPPSGWIIHRTASVRPFRCPPLGCCSARAVFCTHVRCFLKRRTRLWQNIDREGCPDVGQRLTMFSHSSRRDCGDLSEFSFTNVSGMDRWGTYQYLPDTVV